MSTISSPVEMIATMGRRPTRTARFCTLARTPISAAPIGMPVRNTVSPARMSSARLRTLVPRFKDCFTATKSEPASVIST